MIETGTRTRQSVLHMRPQQGSMTRTFYRDPGLSKAAISVSLTFTASTAQISGANGTFPAFKGGEIIMVEGCNLNNGFFNVTGVDGSNQSYLTVSPPPKNEGPITVFLRTA